MTLFAVCSKMLHTGPLKYWFEVAHSCFLSCYGSTQSTQSCTPIRHNRCVCVCVHTQTNIFFSTLDEGGLSVKTYRRLLRCLPTSCLSTLSAAERWRDKHAPAATCICTAFLVFNSPQLTVSIVTGWEELKTEKDIQDIRHPCHPPPTRGVPAQTSLQNQLAAVEAWVRRRSKNTLFWHIRHAESQVNHCKCLHS